MRSSFSLSAALFLIESAKDQKCTAEAASGQHAKFSSAENPCNENLGTCWTFCLDGYFLLKELIPPF